MKLFISLVLFWFCQVAFGLSGGVIGTLNLQTYTGGTCELGTPTVTETAVNTYLFSYPISYSTNLPMGSTSIACMFGLSSSTNKTGLIGGFKIKSSNIKSSTGTSDTISSACGVNKADSLSTFQAFQIISGWSFISSTNQSGSCAINITILLEPDKSSATFIKQLCPLISMAAIGTNTRMILDTKLDISDACQTPSPSPIATCSLSVPSNISLGNATPESFGGSIIKRMNATDFTIAVNCSKPVGTPFIPNVQMTFGSTFGVTCFAQNMATGANAATNVFIDIFRNDTSQTVCPKTATVPTTLVFKQNTTPTVSYSDNLTLRAAFVNANFPSTATPGIFTTTATFTITFP